MCSCSRLESGGKLDLAGVGVEGDSRPSVEGSSMILSRDARELKCVRDRVRGRRRMSCVAEGSGDAWDKGSQDLVVAGRV